MLEHQTKLTVIKMLSLKQLLEVLSSFVAEYKMLLTYKQTSKTLINHSQTEWIDISVI